MGRPHGEKVPPEPVVKVTDVRLQKGLGIRLELDGVVVVVCEADVSLGGLGLWGIGVRRSSGSGIIARVLLVLDVLRVE